MTDVVVPLSPMQTRVLDEIRRYVGVHGFAPSLRELGGLCGRGTSSVAYQVDQLVAKGYLRRGPRQARALVLVEAV